MAQSADSPGCLPNEKDRLLDVARVSLANCGRGRVGLLGVSDVAVTIMGDDAVVSASAGTAPASVAEPAVPTTVFPSPTQVAERLAACLVDDLRRLLATHRMVRVALSSGASPAPTYQLLTRVYRDALAWERVMLVQMDEYASLPSDDPRAFRMFLQSALLAPLGMPSQLLTGHETDEQMQRRESDLVRSGGLHLVLHGVGRNGHLAFNEPGTAPEAKAGRVRLAVETRAAAVPAFGAAPPTHGVTFGLGLLNRSPHVRVVATGALKRGAIQRGLCRPPAIRSPLSFLQGHPDCQAFIDVAACPWLVPP